MDKWDALFPISYMIYVGFFLASHLQKLELMVYSAYQVYFIQPLIIYNSFYFTGLQRAGSSPGRFLLC